MSRGLCSKVVHILARDSEKSRDNYRTACEVHVINNIECGISQGPGRKQLTHSRCLFEGEFHKRTIYNFGSRVKENEQGIV